MIKLKKIFMVLMTILQIISASVFSYGAETDVEHTAVEMSAFNPDIKINTDDLNSYLKKVFDYKPELEFYYAGYSSTSYGDHHNVTFKYDNTEIPIEDINIANNKEDLINILSKAILYCNKKLYVIADTSYDLESITNELVNDNQIVVMGYHGFSASTFQSKITNNTCYNIEFSYTIDENTLLSYKKATEAKAIEIITNNICKSMPDYVKEKIIHDYIIDYTDYSSENGEIAYMPYDALVNGKGVCSAYAGSAKIMFDLLGIENYYVSGTATNSETTEKHGWNIVKLEDGYYHIDITWDDPVTIFGFNTTKYDYFNKTDDEMSENHIWDKTAYPQCIGSKYSYDNITDYIKISDKFTDYYKADDFVSIFDKYSTEENTILENTTEYTTEAIMEKDYMSIILDLYNQYEQLPIKYKIELFIIIAVILFILYVM